MLAVDWQDPDTAPRCQLSQQTTGDHQALLVRQGDVLSSIECRMDGRQTGSTNDSCQNEVDFPVRCHFDQSLLTTDDSRPLWEPLGQRCSRLRITNRYDVGLKLGYLRLELAEFATPHGQRDDSQSIRVVTDDLERAGADRAGGSENSERLLQEIQPWSPKSTTAIHNTGAANSSASMRSSTPP